MDTYTLTLAFIGSAAVAKVLTDFVTWLDDPRRHR